MLKFDTPRLSPIAPFLSRRVSMRVAMEESTIVEFSGYSVDFLLGAKPPLAVALMRATSFQWMRRFAEVVCRLPAP